MLLLKNGVIFLADNSQNFINACISAFGINPICSYGTPSYTKKASVKNTGE